jgi:2-keto-3-deoxy-L-rhamnonate aldolase RhmA
MTETQISFRQRFISGELLLGTFIKTPTTHAVEILGGLGFDFVVIDEEHAPFDRVTIDNLLLAARASITAGIVRVAEATPAKLLAALDDGAASVLVPHISTVAMCANGPTDQCVRSAAERIIAAGRKVGKPVCIMVGNAKEAADWHSLGANSFIVASDQGFMRQAAARTRTEFSELVGARCRHGQRRNHGRNTNCR